MKHLIAALVIASAALSPVDANAGKSLAARSGRASLTKTAGTLWQRVRSLLPLRSSPRQRAQLRVLQRRLAAPYGATKADKQQDLVGTARLAGVAAAGLRGRVGKRSPWRAPLLDAARSLIGARRALDGQYVLPFLGESLTFAKGVRSPSVSYDRNTREALDVDLGRLARGFQSEVASLMKLVDGHRRRKANSTTAQRAMDYVEKQLPKLMELERLAGVGSQVEAEVDQRRPKIRSSDSTIVGLR